MSASIDLREIALDILTEITKEHVPGHLAINRAMEKHQYLDKSKRSFLSRLTWGTIEYMVWIDYVINQYSTVPVTKMKPVIRNILRMGVYQLKYMDNVPASAACNEAVKLARKRGFTRLSGFVNGVLRNISRDICHLKYPDKAANPSEYLAIVYSMPEWIVKRWLKVYAEDEVEEILSALLETKALTIRPNSLMVAKDELSRRLTDEHVKVTNGSYLNDALKISDIDYLGKLESFRNGEFIVQDESSMIAVEAAGIRPGNTVIDVCASPGGKSLLAAEKLKDTGTVYARDINSYKIEKILENIKRMGIRNIQPQCKDAAIHDPSDDLSADIVIADLPCSGLGVIGKKPDIKYTINEGTIKDLISLQRKILSAIWPYVVPGGILIYSTCTINTEENIDNVKWFTEHHPFRLESLNPYLPVKLHNETTNQGYIQLLPGIHQCDGFFIARLKRI